MKKPSPNAKGFKVADGSFVPDFGTADVPARTEEGDELAVQWKNAKVAMPILSTKKLTAGGKGLWYHETGGSIVNPARAIKSDFIESGDVYFIKLLVPRALRRGNTKPDGNAGGFARQGAAAA